MSKLGTWARLDNGKWRFTLTKPVAKYDDLQPRNPSGTPEGGQWRASSTPISGEDRDASIFREETDDYPLSDAMQAEGFARSAVFHERAIQAQQRVLTTEEHAWVQSLHSPLFTDLRLYARTHDTLTVAQLMRGLYPFHQTPNARLRTRANTENDGYGTSALRGTILWQRAMDQAMERFGVETPEAMVVERGLRLEGKDRMSAVERGDHYVDRGYVSVSVNDANSIFGDVTARVIIPKGIRVLPVDIDDMGELVLPRNTEFRALVPLPKEYEPQNAEHARAGTTRRATALFSVVPHNRRFTRTVPKGSR